MPLRASQTPLPHRMESTGDLRMSVEEEAIPEDAMLELKCSLRCAAWVLQTPVPHSMAHDNSDIHATVKFDASCHVQKTQSLDTGRFLQITVSKDLRDLLPDSSWLCGGRLIGRRCSSTVPLIFLFPVPSPTSSSLRKLWHHPCRLVRKEENPAIRPQTTGRFVEVTLYTKPEAATFYRDLTISGGKSGHGEVYNTVICRYSKVSPSGLCAAEQYLSMQIGSDCSNTVEAISKCSLWALGCGLMVPSTVILCLFFFFFLLSVCERER